MNNLVKRTLSAVVFGAAFLGLLLLNSFLFAVLLTIVAGVALFEFYRMSMGKSYPVLQWMGIAAGAVIVWLVYAHYAFGMDARLIGLAILMIAAVVIASLFQKDKSDMGKTAYVYTGLLYIAAPLSLASMLVFRNGEFEPFIMLTFFFLIWASDIGAYSIGTMFGQKPDSRKLAPQISPKKSWAGFWGGLALCVLVAVILGLTGVISYPVHHCIVLAVIIHCCCVSGDLFESMWKRNFGVKDSGNFMPGHGGMLDRFDSALLAIPVGAVYLNIFNLI